MNAKYLTFNKNPRKRGRRERGGDPNGIRTRVAGVKGRCPRPLDDGVAAVLYL